MRRGACGAAVIVAILTPVAACTIDVSMEGRRCPCVEGFVCDAPLDRCVPHTCDPAVTVTGLAVAWATPNTIALRWTPSAGDGLASYTILVGDTLDDLASGAARRIDASENPELGVSTASPWTIVRDLDPSRTYLARVLVDDATGCAATSEVISAQTSGDAAGYLDVFDGAVTSPAYTAPASGLVIDDGQLVYTPAEDPECEPVPGADPICGQPLRIQGLAIPLARTSEERPGLDEASFARAFVEVHVENVGPLPSSFAEVFLRFDGCNPDLRQLYELAGFTLPARPGFQIVQVPLAQLAQAGVSPRAPLTFATVDQRAAGTPLCGVGLGAQWNKGGRVRIDQIKIRY